MSGIIVFIILSKYNLNNIFKIKQIEGFSPKTSNPYCIVSSLNRKHLSDLTVSGM